MFGGEPSTGVRPPRGHRPGVPIATPRVACHLPRSGQSPGARPRPAWWQAPDSGRYVQRILVARQVSSALGARVNFLCTFDVVEIPVYSDGEHYPAGIPPADRLEERRPGLLQHRRVQVVFQVRAGTVFAFSVRP